MSDLDDKLPPDPWADEGVDLWTLEQAEELVRAGVTGDDPRWRALEDGPLLDDFDADQDDHDAGGTTRSAEGLPFRTTRRSYGLGLLAGLLAVLLVVALVLMMLR